MTIATVSYAPAVISAARVGNVAALRLEPYQAPLLDHSAVQPAHFALMVKHASLRLGALLVGAASLSAQPRSELETSFVEPPDSARPRAYWFHMSGNITKPGITADLEAMRAIGLGGTLFMNVSVALPTGLAGDTMWPDMEWIEALAPVPGEAEAGERRRHLEEVCAA